MEFDQELDVRGQVCPYPALRTKKELMRMAPGQVLKVMIDHPPAVDSVKREVEKTKSKFLATEDEGDGEWNVYFECVK
jgi:tRNA 2-thiouridine synthesizing protein A